MSARTAWDVGDRDGFMACYDATRHVVYRYAVRLTGNRQQAEDLVHDVYVETLRRARDGGLEPIGAGWLCRAVRNRHLDRLRSAERERNRIRLVHAGTSVDEQVDDGNADADLLVGLTPRERAAVVMHHVDGISVAEVATSLGATVRATESLLARARAKARTSRHREVRDA